MSNVPKASVNLHAYLNWRRGLVALDVGTIIRFNTEYAALTICENIKKGQHFKIVRLHERLNWFHEDIPASKSYELQLCTKNGVLHKTVKYWSVEGIAAFLLDDIVSITSTP